MKAEKVILSFIAILIGLVVAGGAFYAYQATKVVPETNKKIVTSNILPTPTPESIDTSYIAIDQPKDEQVIDKRTVTITGKTRSDAVIIVSSENTDQVAKPASDGSFSLTHTVGTGTTIIEITAVLPDGTEKSVTKTVTFSTESF